MLYYSSILRFERSNSLEFSSFFPTSLFKFDRQKRFECYNKITKIVDSFNQKYLCFCISTDQMINEKFHDQFLAILQPRFLQNNK